jgi:hypothetical protein
MQGYGESCTVIVEPDQRTRPTPALALTVGDSGLPEISTNLASRLRPHDVLLGQSPAGTHIAFNCWLGWMAKAMVVVAAVLMVLVVVLER